MFAAAAGQARPPRARARDPRAAGSASGTFERLREQNRGGPTLQLRRRPGHGEQDARRPHGLGPHAQGRLPALQGAARLRPALPERLRLPGPLDRGRRRARARPQLEARDRGVRPRRVRAQVPRGGRLVGAASSRAGSMRLGQWMDWGNDYFTFSRHEHRVHLALPASSCTSAAGSTSATARPSGARAAARRSRRTSCVGSYEDRADPSLFVRFPLLDRPGESLVDLDDDAVDAAGERRRGGQARTPSTGAARTASGSPVARYPDEDVRRARAGRGARRLALRGPVRRPAPRRGGRAPRDPLGRGLARGGHRASSTSRRAAAREDFELSRVHDLPCSCRSTRPAASTTTTAGCTGSRRSRPRSRSSATSASAALLVEPEQLRAPLSRTAGAATRRSSSASRTTGSSRSTSCARSCSRRTRPSSGRPTYMGKRMDDWLAQHGRLEHLAPPLLRAAAAVLPLRVRAPERGRLARRARGARASAGSTSSRSCTGRGSTRSRSAARRAARRCARIPEVGDVWLDAGIVPFSTLGWQNPEWVAGGLRDRRRRRA